MFLYPPPPPPTGTQMLPRTCKFFFSIFVILYLCGLYNILFFKNCDAHGKQILCWLLQNWVTCGSRHLIAFWKQHRSVTLRNEAHCWDCLVQKMWSINVYRSPEKRKAKADHNSFIQCCDSITESEMWWRILGHLWFLQ